MVLSVASLRHLHLWRGARLPLRLWWAPASALTLGAAAGGILVGWHPARWWPDWVMILVVGLAGSAARRKLLLFRVPMGRVLLWAVFGLVVVKEISSAGLRLRDWDVMLVTGVLAFVIAVEMTHRIPARLTAAFKRLGDRGVLAATPNAEKEFTARSEKYAGEWAWLGGLVVALITLGAWIAALAIAFSAVPSMSAVLTYPPVLFECLCGWIAGERIVHMIAVGASWRSYTRDGAAWRLMPGHPDGAGGFKPIGDFFFYQATIAAIPAIYLAAWWWLIPLVPAYADWRRPYLILLIAAIALEMLAFVWPMRSVHVIMRTEKARLLPQADRLSRRIDSLQQRLSRLKSIPNLQQFRDSIAELTEQYMQIEEVPIWPVDSSIRRRFSLSNIALFLPFVGYVVGGTSFWQDLSDALHGLGK
jgi:hypothetical protein